MAPTWSLALEGLKHQSPGRHPLGAATKAIGACGRAQLWQWALEVSDLVKVQGLQPDAFILGATVSSTEKASQWRSAIALGTRSSQTAVTPVVVNSAISACEKGHRWALSLSLLEVSPLRRLEMTVVGSSAAISACASGPWQRALWLFDELPQKDLTPDIIVCNSVLRACAFANAEHLERLLRMIQGHAQEPDVVTYNTLINGYSKQLAWEDSLATLIKGKNSGTLFRSNSLVAYNAALSGQGSDHGWWLCLSMLEDLGSRADVVTCGTVMMCLGRASLSTLALRLLDEADRKHWSNERIYSAAAAACEGESLWKESLMVLCRACRLRLADVVVYGSVGKTCESSSCWEQSLALLPDARSHNTTLSTPFANVVLSSCAKAAVWLHAIQVLSCFGRWS
eukprot:symbB.v1.2.038636.t1/scaffold6091.1/size20991/2